MASSFCGSLSSVSKKNVYNEMVWVKERDMEAEGSCAVPILISIINKIALKLALNPGSCEKMPSFEIALLVIDDWMEHFKQECA